MEVFCKPKHGKDREMEGLKKCPFCGGEAKLHTTKGFHGEIVSAFVGCNNCESSTRNYSTEAGTIEAWNNRA